MKEFFHKFFKATKIWLTEKLFIGLTNNNPYLTQTILQNITHFSLLRISIYGQIVSLNDLKILTESQTLEDMLLCGSGIVNDNYSLVSICDILALAPKIVEFNM